ncbi:hypothetical protein FNV43_RR09702 [Rhamnella rubrinervis]|uniref:Uncharacterized protein n=1 Tax=Rhamnella rubrinervis TaxID=2594499 RepID=A0A8K0HBT9_9ROSA|nr:hypothetical protein FNV43_RR09702 [Rhamnella rubrinervis]
MLEVRWPRFINRQGRLPGGIRLSKGEYMGHPASASMPSALMVPNTLGNLWLWVSGGASIEDGEHPPTPKSAFHSSEIMNSERNELEEKKMGELALADRSADTAECGRLRRCHGDVLDVPCRHGVSHCENLDLERLDLYPGRASIWGDRTFNRESSTLGGRYSTQGDLNLGREKVPRPRETSTWEIGSIQSEEGNLNSGNTQPEEVSPQPRKSLTWGEKSSTKGNLNLGRYSTQGNLDLGGRFSTKDGLDLGRRFLDPGKTQPGEIGTRPRESSTLGGRSSIQVELNLGTYILDSRIIQPVEGNLNSWNIEPKKGTLILWRKKLDFEEHFEEEIWLRGKINTKGRTCDPRSSAQVLDFERASTRGGKSDFEEYSTREGRSTRGGFDIWEVGPRESLRLDSVHQLPLDGSKGNSFIRIPQTRVLVTCNKLRADLILDTPLRAGSVNSQRPFQMSSSKGIFGNDCTQMWFATPGYRVCLGGLTMEADVGMLTISKSAYNAPPHHAAFLASKVSLRFSSSSRGHDVGLTITWESCLEVFALLEGNALFRKLNGRLADTSASSQAQARRLEVVSCWYVMEFSRYPHVSLALEADHRIAPLPK